VTVAEMRIEVDDNGFYRRCDYLAARLDDVMREIVGDGVTIAHRNVAVELTRKTHPPGTPTPSVPPEPPALVTGNLRRSAQDRLPVRIGRAIWEGALRMTAAYARIQALGGWAGRDHASYLPPRDYITPAVRATARPLRERAVVRLRMLFQRR
jgi:hypothetical protein